VRLVRATSRHVTSGDAGAAAASVTSSARTTGVPPIDGDRVFFEPDENHWHGAAPKRFMTHLALNEVDADHPAANRGEKVTDEEYAAAPTSER
jgi:hypothetical protein